jgi:nucleoside-diphosphate-sugar epimerase
MSNSKRRIILPGGAGLVGQNLIPRLIDAGYEEIVVLDKHENNLGILRQLHPTVIAACVDLADSGDWSGHFRDAEAVVMLQAQIGGNVIEEFERNNVRSTVNVLSAMKNHGVERLIHISSSVVESVANDWYTNTKKKQEEIVLASELSAVTLRPTLMFGWFDRKHLGWLSRFMQRTPIFPIPGNGRYMRQPLYAGDLCRIILRCLENKELSGTFNISGQEKIDYIDIIKSIKKATASRTIVMKIPIRMFQVLLWVWALWDKDPPFTNQQLEALLANDEFELLNWPEIFAVVPTPFDNAIDSTFNNPIYSQVILEF